MISAHRIQDWLPAGSFGRNVSILSVSTLFAQFTILLSAPLLTRFYAPADFGVLALFISSISILRICSTLAYSKAILLPRDDLQAFQLLILCLALLLTFSLVVLTFLSLASDTILRWFGITDLYKFVWYFPIALIALQIEEILCQWTIRKRNFKTLARSKISYAIGMVAVNLALGFAGIGAIGLILGEMAGRSLAIATLFVPIRQNSQFNSSVVRPRELVQLFRRYQAFPKYQLPSMLSTQLSINLPTVVMALWYGPLVTGMLLLAQNVMGAPMLVIGRSVARVYLGEAAALVHDQRSRLSRLYRRTFFALLGIASVPVLLVCLVGPYCFGIVFGKEWQGAAAFLLPMSLSVIFQFAMAPLIQTFVVLERQGVMFVWGALRIGLVCFAILLAFTWNFSATTTVWFYSTTSAAAYLFAYHVLNRMLQHQTTGDQAPVAPAATLPLTLPETRGKYEYKRIA